MKLYLLLNEPGSGELSIPVSSAAAIDAVAGKIVAARYRGVNRGGFIIENIKETEVSSEENAGRWKALSGRGFLAILDEAIIWDYDPLIGMDDVEQIRHFTSRAKGDIMYTIVTEAAARGCYPNLNLKFNATTDSNGEDWTDSIDLDIKAGTTHLDVMRTLAALGLCFEMKQDEVHGKLDFYAYQTELGSDVSDKVHFRIGHNCLNVDNTEQSSEIRNALIVSIPNPTYPWSIQTDPTSIAAYRRREHFLSAGDAPNAAIGTLFGTAELKRLKDPKHVIAIKVSDAIGSRVFVDYNLGDWVYYDNGSGIEVKYRIKGLQLEWTENWYADVVVELNDQFVETQIRTALDTRKTGGASSGSPLKSPQSAAQASFNQIAVHDLDSGAHGGSPLTTALNDFKIGNGFGVWIKRTLAETKTILGIPATFGDISGTGVIGRVAEFVTNTKTIQAAKIIGPATNILTLTNAAAATLALAITAGKTLTLTATDNFNLTIPASGTIILDGDARLTDARTPLAHNQAWSTINSGVPTTIGGYGITDIVKAGAGVLTLSSAGAYTLTVPASGTVILDGDARLTDARTPLAHNQAWSTITSGVPTTIGGYGITDIIKAGAGVLTLSSAGAYTLTVPATGTVAMLGISNTFTDVLNISTATNFKLAAVAYTGTMANLNTLRDDSMADALHRHSELSASDGTPDQALTVNSVGRVGIGVASAGYPLEVNGDIAINTVSNAVFRFQISDVEQGSIYSLTTDDDFNIRATKATGGLNLRAGGSTVRLAISSAGAVTIAGTFGCNGAAARAPYASGGDITPGAGAYGASSAANFAAMVTLVKNIRIALVNNGIMS